MMMMPNNSTQAQLTSITVNTTPESIQPPMMMMTSSSSSQELQTAAKQRQKAVLVTVQPLSGFQAWRQEACTVVVMATPSPSSNSHKAKFQDTQLIHQLQTQVGQVANGLQQLQCTQQFEEETLRLFNKMQKAFQADNAPLVKRHWHSWLQVTALLEQETTTLYGAAYQPLETVAYFAPYCLPSWLFEKTVPETREAIAHYEQFWLNQQEETAERYENAQRYSNQVQIKLENWLAAKTAPKSS